MEVARRCWAAVEVAAELWLAAELVLVGRRKGRAAELLLAELWLLAREEVAVCELRLLCASWCCVS